MSESEHGLSEKEKEMGLKPEETRVLNDAKFIKGGARKVDGGRLEVTKAQLKRGESEMNEEFGERKDKEVVDELVLEFIRADKVGRIRGQLSTDNIDPAVVIEIIDAYASYKLAEYINRNLSDRQKGMVDDAERRAGFRSGFDINRRLKSLGSELFELKGLAEKRIRAMSERDVQEYKKKDRTTQLRWQ